MKKITLQIENEHYDIMQRLAALRKMELEDMILESAKSSISVFLRMEVLEAMSTQALYDELLGGTDKS